MNIDDYFKTLKKSSDDYVSKTLFDYNNPNFWVSFFIPTLVFNKEICHPGVKSEYPDGAIAIYSDDSFFCVAVLPYEYKDISIQEIIKVIFRHELSEDFDLIEYLPDEEAEK